MAKHEFSDERLLKEVNARTEASYKVLHARFFRSMFVMAAKITRDNMEAEDIVHTAFVKLYTTKRAVQFEYVSQISGYIAAIVRNNSIDFKEKRDRHPIVDFEENVHVPSHSFNELDLFELKFRENVWALVTNRVLEKMESLDLHCIRVLKLRYLDGKSTKEIAKLMQLSPQTVLNHATKAREIMANYAVKEKWLFDTFLVIILLSKI